MEERAKSVGLATLLALLFGPIGMLYTTVKGAVIMAIVSIIAGGLMMSFGLFDNLVIGFGMNPIIGFLIVVIDLICAYWSWTVARGSDEKIIIRRR